MFDTIKRTLLVPLWESGPTGITLIINGLQTTIGVTILAGIGGLIIGVVFALMRLSSQPVVRGVARTYIEIIRGTPVLVQLLIIYFVVFRAVAIDKTAAAALAFSINSGAYTAEIIRAGIQAVHHGQSEAARSLGMSKALAMRKIILPQAFRNILPALGNEMIVLLKETSIIGFIGGNDLMRAGTKIRSITYEATTPLFAVAMVYLALTYTMSIILHRVERRLQHGIGNNHGRDDSRGTR